MGMRTSNMAIIDTFIRIGHQLIYYAAFVKYFCSRRNLLPKSHRL